MEKKYLNISELSILLGLTNKSGKPANYILRFWEKSLKILNLLLLKVAEDIMTLIKLKIFNL